MRVSTTLACIAVSFLASRSRGDDADRWKTPKPALPDLSVTYIERLPRYPGSKMEYRRIDEGPDGVKGDGLPARLANPDQQKWPRAGQMVTFVAHVKNAGGSETPRYDYRWVVDGEDLIGQSASGWDSPLAPDQERTYRLKWVWKTGRHFIAFEVNSGRKFEEITHKNNAVVDATDALAFHFFVQPRVAAWFREHRNGFDSYCWEDWARFQVQEMNREFRDEIHPSTPNGITLRVRLDRVVVLPENYKDPGGTHAPEDNVTGGSDGVWGFTNDLMKPNAEGKNFYEANPQWLLGPEWPLHHELGHQLGQPDYYLLPVQRERNEPLKGVEYMPPGWFQDQMMFSGNYAHDNNIGKGKGTWDSGYRFWGEHAARAFNRDRTMRRGFFGTFLADVPKSNSFVFLDDKSRPLPGAEVDMHVAVSRDYGNARFKKLPDFRFKTDPAGAATLSRSPWNVVLNWSCNGAIEFIVRPNGGPKRVGFLNITDFNAAYWRGHRQHATYFVVTRGVEFLRRKQ